MSKSNLPRFLVADNPLVGPELYIIHTKQPMCIIRAHDMVIIEGEASDKLLNKVKDWYKSYLLFVNR